MVLGVGPAQDHVETGSAAGVGAASNGEEGSQVIHCFEKLSGHS